MPRLYAWSRARMCVWPAMPNRLNCISSPHIPPGWQPAIFSHRGHGECRMGYRLYRDRIGAVVEGGTQSACTEYTLTFDLKMNDRSEFDRETTVEIRSGDLVRTVRIIQEGTDFKRDPTRRVMIHGLGGPRRSLRLLRLYRQRVAGRHCRGDACGPQ